MKLADMTHDDWIAWMKRTPEGLTLYVDDATIDHLGEILAAHQRFCSESYPNLFEVHYKNSVKFKRTRSLYRQGKAAGRQEVMDKLLQVFK